MIIQYPNVTVAPLPLIDIEPPTLSNFDCDYGVVVSVDTDKATGVVYFVIVPDGTAVPGVEQIIAGTDGAGNSAVWAASLPIGSVDSFEIGPEGLDPGTDYTGYAVHRSAAGIDSAVVSDDFSTGPGLLTVAPTNGATGVSLRPTIQAVFTDTVALGTGLVEIYTVGGALVESFDVATEVGSAAGQVEIMGGNTLVIHPTSHLNFLVGYHVEIAPTAIEDLNGVPFAGIEDDETWAFTVGSPSLLYASGEDGDWWMPADLTKLFADEAGTTPATAVDDLIRRMDGQRGVHNVTCGAGVEPQLKQTVGGKWYLQGDVDDRLQKVSAMPITPDLFMVWAGSYDENIATASAPLVMLGASTTQLFIGVLPNSQEPVLRSWWYPADKASIIAKYTTGLQVTIPGVISGQFSDGTQWVSLDNGPPVSEANTWAEADVTDAMTLTLMYDNGGSGLRKVPSKLHFALIINREPTTDEKSALQTFAAGLL